jgi:hypothetical protein
MPLGVMTIKLLLCFLLFFALTPLQTAIKSPTHKAIYCLLPPRAVSSGVERVSFQPVIMPQPVRFLRKLPHSGECLGNFLSNG